MLGKTVKLKKGKVRLRVKCTLAKGKRCKGKVYLRTRAKKPKALASRRMNIKGAKKGWVTLKLSRKARKRVRRKRNKVQAVIKMGAARSTKNLTLKR